MFELADIANATGYFFDITLENLRGPNRKREWSHPRHVAIYLCHELTGHSLTAIGNYFGGRDHTTVIFAVRKIKRGELAGEVDAVRKIIATGSVARRVRVSVAEQREIQMQRLSRAWLFREAGFLPPLFQEYRT